MDLFSPAKSPREALLLLAARIAESIGRSPNSMPHELRTSFAGLADAETIWSFALILAGWHARERGEATALLAPLNLESLYGQLGSVPLLGEFVKKAAAATSLADLSGAGAYFATAIENLGVPLLRMALMSPAFRQARESLLRTFPPAEVRALLSGAAPASSASGAIASRTRRFERADFRFRYGQAPAASDPMPPVELEPRTPSRAMSSAMTPLPTLELPEEPGDRRAAALEWLGDVGYEPHEIEAIAQRRVKFS